MKLKVSLLAAFGLALTAMGLAGFSASADGGLAPVYWFEDTVHKSGTEVSGSFSTLVRTSDGVTASIATSALLPGHAYSVWWVVFNNPSLCNQDGCGVDDVGAALGSGTNPAAIGVLRAGGAATGADGKLSVGASLQEGFAGGCQTSVPFAGLCTVLVDSTKAEIHIVLHDHGPVIAGMLNEQVGTFEGGCKNFIDGQNGMERVPYGLGSYECFSPQASPHTP